MNATALLLSLLLLVEADVPRATKLRPADASVKPDFANAELPLFSTGTDAEDQAQAPAQQGQKKATLQPTSKLELIRYVSGEFAKAAKALPAGKDGFLLFVDKPLNQNLLDSAVATHGAAVHPGEQVQITKLDFREHTIIVDVNGGGRGKKRFMDRVHIDMGGVPTMRTTTEAQQTGPPGVEFNKTIPDLTPDELKKMLSPFLDFNRQRSASVLWIDTLPTDIKKAIQDRVAKVGMDREMVVAAIGKPGHKVRERDSEGNDIEEWIYGTPPDRTVFVRFMGDKVTSIKQFPQ